MKSHHFIGIGRIPADLAKGETSPLQIADTITKLVAECGLTVVSEYATGFDKGGKTLAWILAESHLVLHLWMEEGFATLDLHVCDYRRSNVEGAKLLRNRLNEVCFADGACMWREMSVEYP